MYSYWLKQPSDKPLFPDLLWSRPENRAYAGKLLIIGGSSSGFSLVGECYNYSLQAGVGVAKVMLPKSLEKVVSQIFPEAEFAPDTPSGSFSSSALATLLDASSWADTVLLAGDLGKNSETAILLEKLLDKYSGDLVLAGDSLDFFTSQPGTLLARPATTIVASFSQLQKIATSYAIAITAKLGLLQLVEKLHELSQGTSANIITNVDNQVLVASGGQFSSTKMLETTSTSQLAAYGAVWQLQNKAKVFEALTTASYELANSTSN